MNSGNTKKNVIYDKYAYCSIAAITIFYLINNLIWLKLNVYPHGPDEFSHLFIAQNFYNALHSGKIGYLINLFKSSTDTFWPPLFHFTAAGLSFVLGNSSTSPLIINLFCLLTLLFSVYSIGCQLYNKTIGILAILLLSLYPMVFRYSRFFGPDFAQMSVLCLSIYLLICTEHFLNRRFSVLFGISIGFGLLIKLAFALFLVGPLAYIVLQIFFLRTKRRIRLRVVLVNLTLSLLIGTLISLIWYLPSFASMSIRLKMFFHTFVGSPFVQQSISKAPEAFELDKSFGYLRFLVNEQISFLFLLVFVLALPFFFKKRENKLILVFWYICPFIALSLSSYKEGRFMLSALPAVALISAVGLQELFSYRPNYFLKHLFYAMLISLGLVQFFDVSYNYARKDKTLPFKTPIGILHMLCYPTTEQHGWGLYGPPFKKDWKFEKIAASIVKSSSNKFQTDSQILVGVIGEDDYVRLVFGFPKTLDYYLARENTKAFFRCIELSSPPSKDDWSFIKKIDDFNYIIFISGLKSWPGFDDLKPVFNKFLRRATSLGKLRKYLYNIKQPYDFKDAPERLRKFIDNKDDNFILIEKIKLADGYDAYVYTRK